MTLNRPVLSLVESRIVCALEHLALARLGPSATDVEVVEAGVHVNFAEIQLRRALMTASDLQPDGQARRLMDNLHLKGVEDAAPALTFHRAEKLS